MISKIPPSICIDHVTYRNSILLGVGERACGTGCG